MKVSLSKLSLLVVVFALFFYSFTQVDLSLTLSQVSIWQGIQKGFQQIGWFNRPISTLLFVLIITSMTAYYVWFLKKAWLKEIKIKEVWILVGVTAAVLAFSYNAFSYDLFNYIFDAKIITHYQANPYLHKALDYPGDPMLSFMQWTHRLYPYGPVWLGITVPLSFAGMNFFLLTFFLFKFMITGFYVGCVYLIYKINEKMNPEHAVFSTVLFAFNPLVIVESLVSSHNDIVMIFFALLGVYLYFLKKKIWAIVAIIVSSQIKIPTIALLLPIILSFDLFKVKFTNERFVQALILAMIVSFGYVLTKLEIQPWYFLWIIPFLALLKPNKFVIAATIGLSMGLLARYSVFLYFGNWGGIGVILRNSFTVILPIISILIVLVSDKSKSLIRAIS